MTPRPPQSDELLSACHDGELSVAERAEVDHLLRETPALHETLDDYRELSSILQSIPRPAAPVALQAKVLQQIQAGRVQAGPALQSRQPTSPEATPFQRRLPWMWGAALLTTTAVLLVVVYRPSPEQTQIAQGTATEAAAAFASPEMASSEMMEMASPSATAPEQEWPMAAAISQETLPLPTSPVPSVMMRRGAAPLMADSPPGSAAGGAGMDDGIAEAGPASMARGGVANLPLNSASLAEQLSLDPASPPAASDILAYIDRVGDQTVIVEFDVVDVERSNTDLSVLLQRRGVRVVGAANQPTAEEKTNTAGGPPLVALYVEATDAQLAAVVEDMLSHVAFNEGAALNGMAAGPMLTEQLGDQIENADDRSGSRRMLRSRSVSRQSLSNSEPPSLTRSVPGVEPRVAAPQMSTFSADSPQLKAMDATNQLARQPLTDLGTGTGAGEVQAQAVRFSLPAERYAELEARSVAGEAYDRNSEGLPDGVAESPQHKAANEPRRPMASDPVRPMVIGETPIDPTVPDREPVRRALIVLQGSM